MSWDKNEWESDFFIISHFNTFYRLCFAANSASDFKVDGNYKHVLGNEYYSVNLNDNKDTGCLIFKNVDDDLYDNHNDPYDHIIHDDGRDYIKADDDMKINKNPDNTANFTDMDHSTHGVVEVVNSNGQQYIVVFFAKDSTNIQNKDLASQLTQFNNDNQVKAVAF